MLAISSSTALAGFMAVGAVYARLLRFMAVHAPGHGDVALAEKPVALADLPMAVLAPGAFFEMPAVAEDDVVRNAIDPHPIQLLPFPGSRRHPLDMRTLGLDRRMALHAYRGPGDRHGFAG